MVKVLNPNVRRIWTGDVGTYPVVACITIALGWTTYMSTRALFFSPDVVIGRVERGSLFKANREAKSVTWYESHKKYYVPDAGKIRIISSAP